MMRDYRSPPVGLLPLSAIYASPWGSLMASLFGATLMVLGVGVLVGCIRAARALGGLQTHYAGLLVAARRPGRLAAGVLLADCLSVRH